MKASDIMSRDIISIGLGHGVRHAAQIMRSQGISGLPVLDDEGSVVGILTEGDIMRRLETCRPTSDDDIGQDLSAQSLDDFVLRSSWKAADCMSSTVISVSGETTVNRIVALMLANNIKRVPVMHQDRIVGIVSRSDLLDCIVSERFDRSRLDDAGMTRSIHARLHHDLHMPPGAIDVSVSDGSVVLSGEVASQSMRRAATVVAETVSGVTSVSNRLKLSAEGVDEAKP